MINLFDSKCCWFFFFSIFIAYPLVLTAALLMYIAKQIDMKWSQKSIYVRNVVHIQWGFQISTVKHIYSNFGIDNKKTTTTTILFSLIDSLSSDCRALNPFTDFFFFVRWLYVEKWLGGIFRPHSIIKSTNVNQWNTN